MRVKELDIVLLQDGREATILEQLDAEHFLVEIADPMGKTLELPIVTLTQIEKILYIS